MTDQSRSYARREHDDRRSNEHGRDENAKEDVRRAVPYVLLDVAVVRRHSPARTGHLEGDHGDQQQPDEHVGQQVAADAAEERQPLGGEQHEEHKRDGGG